jgi:hypothetical protein
MTMQEQSVGADGTAMETKEDKLLQAVKRFQESETVQSHPEILSGKGAFDARTAEDAQNLVRKHRNRRALLESEGDRDTKTESSGRGNRQQRLENLKENGVKLGSKSPLNRSPFSTPSLSSMNEQKRSKNWLKTLSVSLASNSSSSNTDDYNPETMGDDDYTNSFDLSKLVFQQCNIIAYWYSEGKILNYCGKLQTCGLI